VEDSCLFCRIASGALQAEKVHEDEDCMAFLDHRPLFPGHTLVIPRAHYETLLDLPEQLYAPLMSNVRLLAAAMESGLGAEGSFIAQNNRISQSVPHLHMHVIPRRKGDGMRGFFWPRQQYDGPAHMSEVAGKLREEIRRLRLAKD
jgi:histidine triad (HIT) family protein